MVDTVNANRDYFEAGVSDLSRAELEVPSWLAKLLMHPVKALDNFAQMMRFLTEERGPITVFVNVDED